MRLEHKTGGEAKVGCQMPLPYAGANRIRFKGLLSVSHPYLVGLQKTPLAFKA